MAEIIVVETIKAIPGKEQSLKQALLALVPVSLAEAGCSYYEVADPIDKLGTFLVLMRMTDMAALKEHHNSEHIAEFVQKYDHILYDEVEEVVWQSLSI